MDIFISKKIIRYSLIIAISFLGVFIKPSILIAATLSVTPQSASVSVGERISFSIFVESNLPINAASSLVNIPPEMLSIESISKAGSILNFWVSEPTFSKAQGTVNFEGVVLGGYQSPKGQLITINARALKQGDATVSLRNSSVLANDGMGSELISGTRSASIKITEAAPKPKTKEEPVEEEPRTEETSDAPEIFLNKKFGEKAIYGKSKYPDAEVVISFVSETGDKVYITDKTDQKGDFSVIVPQTLRKGIYKVSATAVKRDVSRSKPSNEIKVEIGNYYSDVGWEIKIPILLLLLIVIYLITRLSFSIRSQKNIKHKVHNEAHEAESALRKSFKKIRLAADDIKVSKLSEDRLDKLKQNLNSAEEDIASEIKDIERL